MELYYYETDENDDQIENEENENEVYSFNIDLFIDNNLI